ncbi:hypothetical protein CPter91_5179 [Collimonas pratensis]|uniref:Uncharacterized protein n=1 Tax=Collimonas pratensis TaxID=279113 RepID=A0A127QBP7_9BURK|nr:hypothetical protein CPter91_5179 [Collimonas pratensis]
MVTATGAALAFMANAAASKAPSARRVRLFVMFPPEMRWAANFASP